MFGLFRRLALVLTVAAVLVTGSALAAPKSASAATVNSTFNFSNDSIASFYAKLHYSTKWDFTLTDVHVRDLSCDSRSVYADVFDQNGQLGRFVNSSGCGSDAYWNYTAWHDGGGVRYVQIRLRACNTFGCSSSAWSLKHYNPYD